MALQHYLFSPPHRPLARIQPPCILFFLIHSALQQKEILLQTAFLFRTWSVGLSFRKKQKGIKENHQPWPVLKLPQLNPLRIHHEMVSSNQSLVPDQIYT
jgi:hypothetical protein